MKNRLFLIFTIVFSLNSAEFLEIFKSASKNKDKDTSVIIASDVAEKKHQLTLLQEEKTNLENNLDENVASINNEIDKTSKKITELQSSLKKPDIENKEFLNDLLNLEREILQTLNDVVFFKKQHVPILEQHIKLIQDYLNNPNFSNLKIEPQSYYTFETLESLNQKALNLEDNLARLQDEKTALESELDNRKKDLISTEKELKILKSKQKEFLESKNSDEKNPKQNAEIVDLKVQFLDDKKRLLEEKTKESSLKLNIISTKLFSIQAQLTTIKQDLRTVERKLRVYESDIEKNNKKIDQIRKETASNQVKLSNQIKKITEQNQKTNSELNTLSSKLNLNVSTLNSLVNWSLETKSEKAETEQSLVQIGFLQDKSLADEFHLEFLEAKKESLQNKLASEEITSKIIEAWHKITQKKGLKTEEEINSIKSEFESFKRDQTRTIALYKDKIGTATRQINSQAKVLNTLKDKIESFKKRADEFRDKNLYQDILSVFKKSETEIGRQINYSSELIKVYSTIIANTKDALKQVDQIINMLDRIGGSVLYRSEYAISAQNLKAIGPEIRIFLSDIKNISKTYISYFKFANLWKFIKNISTNFYFLLKLIALLIFLFLLYILLKKFTPFIANKILEYNASSKARNFVLKIISATLFFVHQNLASLIIWSTLLILIKLEFITQIEHRLIFYLVSIPYLLYLSFRFLNYLLRFNRKHEHSILSEPFEKRFYGAALFLSFSTIIIFLFKEAFNITNYSKAELPTILDATWSIIFRACIIFLIGKEEILSLIPSRPKAWATLRNIIDNYYYLILSGILVLMMISDPYIGGFGKLVSYIIWGIIGSLILLGLLSWLQIIIRKLSLGLFFSTQDESKKERFPHAKTFYALFIILVFISFILLAIYFGSQIWGRPLSIEKFQNILNYRLFLILTDGQQYKEITIASLLIFVSYVIGGIVISWVFKKFVLQRIFNILLVDTGIQSTISSISNYAILLPAVFLGLLKIDISSTTLMYFFSALAVALAFAVKGPANDLIAYFIILVERSIKIGDFVQFTIPGQLPITGVVRKITPRAIILRRKNSVSLVIPNSLVTGNTYYNWSYSNTFFAFDDILITVSYASDPEQVKDILYKVVENNPNVLKTPKPIIRLNQFDPYGFTYLVRGFLSPVNVLLQWDIASDIRIAIVTEIRKNKIDIAIPIRMIITDRNGNQEIKHFPID